MFAITEMLGDAGIGVILDALAGVCDDKVQGALDQRDIPLAIQWETVGNLIGRSAMAARDAGI